MTAKDKTSFGRLTVAGILVTFQLASCHVSSTGVDTKFIVDSSIKPEIERHIIANGDAPECAADIKLFKDGKLDYSINDKGFFAVYTSLVQDTIRLQTFNDGLEHIDLIAAISQDKFHVDCSVEIDGKTFNLKENGAPFSPWLDVPCVKARLKLVNRPAYREHERAEGKIEVTSADFFENDNGKISRCRIEMTAWFLTDPLINTDSLETKMFTDSSSLFR